MIPGRRDLALIAVSLLFAAAAAEIGLRIAGIAYPVFHRLEPLRGWSPLPGVSGVWMTEGEALIENNAEGFRDRDRPLTKPPNTFRIAVIGDSMSEALAVPLEKTYWSILERALARCRGDAVEVMNFSVSGYGTAQQLLTLRHNALKYEPDLVLLAFFTGNDVWNNERALDGHEDRVYFVLEPDGSLREDASNTATARFRTKMLWRGVVNGAINASRLLQLIRESYTRAKTALRGDKARDGAIFDPASGDYRIFVPPATEEWRRAWKTTEALILKMRDAAAAKGAAFGIVNLTAPVQVYPDAALRRAFAKSLGTDRLDYPDRRIAEFAANAGIPAITLLDPLRDHATATGAYLHGFDNTRPGTGHWNDAGHARAAAEIAKVLCERR